MTCHSNLRTSQRNATRRHKQRNKHNAARTRERENSLRATPPHGTRASPSASPEGAPPTVEGAGSGACGGCGRRPPSRSAYSRGGSRKKKNPKSKIDASSDAPFDCPVSFGCTVAPQPLAHAPAFAQTSSESRFYNHHYSTCVHCNWLSNANLKKMLRTTVGQALSTVVTARGWARQQVYARWRAT